MCKIAVVLLHGRNAGMSSVSPQVVQRHIAIHLHLKVRFAWVVGGGKPQEGDCTCLLLALPEFEIAPRGRVSSPRTLAVAYIMSFPNPMSELYMRQSRVVTTSPSIIVNVDKTVKRIACQFELL